MNKLFYIFALVLLIFPMVSATNSYLGSFKQSSSVELIQTCDSCTYVKLDSIKFPNTTKYYNVLMTKNVQTYNYTLNDTDTKGEYSYTVCGDKSGSLACETIDFTINQGGESLTTGKAILFLGFLVIMILLFVGSIILIGMLPSHDERDEEGELLSKKNLKYFRMVLFIVAHVLLIAIFFLASNLALGYMDTEMFGKILFVIYQILFWGLIVTVLLITIWIFYSIFRDKEVKQMLERGVPIGDI